MNVVVVRGRLSRPAEERVLESATRLVTLDVTVARPGERSDSVPVAWMNAPATAAHLQMGEEVVVVGRVRRRFFRAGGSTQSRTEVVATTVVPTRHTKRAAAAVALAVQVINAW